METGFKLKNPYHDKSNLSNQNDNSLQNSSSIKKVLKFLRNKQVMQTRNTDYVKKLKP